MKLKSIHLLSVVALLSSVLSSCSASGDAVNPTISEMDRLDVKWGLPPRQSRGTPHRTVPVTSDRMNMPASDPTPAPAPAPVAAPQNAPAAAPQPVPITVDPSKINTLR